MENKKIKISVKGLRKSFGHLEVLKGMDAEIHEGEVVCLIGPSGSGKSTFLRCLNALENITAGEVIVNGHNLTDKKNLNINRIFPKNVLFKNNYLFIIITTNMWK